MLEQAMQQNKNWCIAYQTNNSINIRPVVDIMENLFFLSGRCHTTCCFRLFLNFLFKRQKENETDV